jgi:hypothetical protein
MSVEIPANSSTPIFDYNRLQSDKVQGIFKGSVFKEFFDATQAFMQKFGIPNISTLIQMPSVLSGKMPGIFSSSSKRQGG